jgi:hypothetical protein
MILWRIGAGVLVGALWLALTAALFLTLDLYT